MSAAGRSAQRAPSPTSLPSLSGGTPPATTSARWGGSEFCRSLAAPSIESRQSCPPDARHRPETAVDTVRGADRGHHADPLRALAGGHASPDVLLLRGDVAVGVGRTPRALGAEARGLRGRLRDASPPADPAAAASRSRVGPELAG